jgi:TRAP-type C4-dicarboxylate transport system permease large subunit
VVRGDLRFGELPGVFVSVARTSAVVMSLVGTASASADLLPIEQVPAQMIAAMQGVTENWSLLSTTATSKESSHMSVTSTSPRSRSLRSS